MKTNKMQHSPSKLIIFDIDGTLISSGSFAKEHFLGAFTDVTGFELDPDGYQFAGMTDRGIVRKMIKMVELKTDFEETFLKFEEKFYQRMKTSYRPEKVAGVLPGVHPLLDDLRDNEDVAITLGTGNCERTAFVKLEYFGLSEYFSSGGFGGEFENRTDVILRAISSGRDILGWAGEAWVVGDTIRDITAGHEAGAKVLAVGTGPRQDHKKMGKMADVFVNDLSDLKIIKSIFGLT